MGGRSVAPQAKWKLVVDFQMLGECVGMLRLGRGSLEREFAGGMIFDQKEEKLFVVGVLVVVRVRGEAWVV